MHDGSNRVCTVSQLACPFLLHPPPPFFFFLVNSRVLSTFSAIFSVILSCVSQPYACLVDALICSPFHAAAINLFKGQTSTTFIELHSYVRQQNFKRGYSIPMDRCDGGCPAWRSRNEWKIGGHMTRVTRVCSTHSHKPAIRCPFMQKWAETPEIKQHGAYDHRKSGNLHEQPFFYSDHQPSTIFEGRLHTFCLRPSEWMVFQICRHMFWWRYYDFI